MITAAELTAMQATQNLVMPGTAIINRATLSNDGMGGQTETWAAVGTVTARLYPIPSQQREYATGGQPSSVSDWFVTVPVGTDVIARDRIIVSSRTFEVQYVNNDEMYQTAVRCEVAAFNEELRA